jgi:hypothetical protein
MGSLTTDLLPRSSGESGFATFTSYASAFFNALTPAENRIENMSPTSSPTTPSSASSIESSRRSSVIGAGGRGGAGNYRYTAYKPTSQSPVSTAMPPIPTPAPTAPSRAHVRGEPSHSGHSASYGHAYDPEMPIASGSSSRGPSGSGSRTVGHSSPWA